MPGGGLPIAIVNASILAMFLIALALLIYAKKPWRHPR